MASQKVSHSHSLCRFRHMSPQQKVTLGAELWRKDSKMEVDPGICMKTKTCMTECHFLNGHFCMVDDSLSDKMHLAESKIATDGIFVTDFGSEYRMNETCRRASRDRAPNTFTGRRSCEKTTVVAAVYDRRILQSTTSAVVDRRYKWPCHAAGAVRASAGVLTCGSALLCGRGRTRRGRASPTPALPPLVGPPTPLRYRQLLRRG